MTRRSLFVTLFILALWLAACAPASTTVAPTLPPATQTPPPTARPRPTDAPSAPPGPTDTRVPTLTAAPSVAPPATVTPGPTSTPTPAPTAAVYSGQGDKVIELDWPNTPALLHTSGNACKKSLTVQPQGQDGSMLFLLVNTKAAYDGVRPFNWDGAQRIAKLHVKAACAWTIEIRPLSDMQALALPGTLDGSGDAVIRLDGTPGSLFVRKKPTGGSFTITGHAGAGTKTAAVVGGGLVPLGVDMLEIVASGAWQIEVTTRR